VAGTIPILRVGQHLLVTVQIELHDRVAEEFQQDLLEAVEKSGARGVIIDITALDFVDSYVARILVETARMARLMGCESVLVGMRPEVAATLVRMGFRMEGVKTALNVDDGLLLLGSRR
jgi:rsbT antagonist protein RsbS